MGSKPFSGKQVQASLCRVFRHSESFGMCYAMGKGDEQTELWLRLEKWRQLARRQWPWWWLLRWLGSYCEWTDLQSWSPLSYLAERFGSTKVIDEETCQTRRKSERMFWALNIGYIRSAELGSKCETAPPLWRLFAVLEQTKKKERGIGKVLWVAVFNVKVDSYFTFWEDFNSFMFTFPRIARYNLKNTTHSSIHFSIIREGIISKYTSSLPPDQ